MPQQIPGKPLKKNINRHKARRIEYIKRDNTTLTIILEQLLAAWAERRYLTAKDKINLEKLEEQLQDAKMPAAQKEIRRLMLENEIRYLAELDKEQAKQSESIVEMMIDDSWERFRWALIALLMAGAMQSFLFFTGIEFPIWSAILLLVVAAIFFVNQTVFEYRVRKGFFGTSDYEAREIVKYIFANGEDIGKGGGGGIRRIAPDPEPEPETGIIPDGKVAA